MSRNYSLAHSLPKDEGGAKFAAYVDDQTSQLDFALPKGIGASTIQGKILGHAAVGVHTQGSPIEALHPQVTLGGVYVDYATTQASPVGSGRAKIAHISNWGETYAVPYPPTPSMITAGSVNTIKSASGIVYEFGAAWNDVNIGDTINLVDNLVGIRTIVIDATSGNFSLNIPGGGIPLTTNVAIQTSLGGGGGASVFISYL